jgi:hypothetical protein
MTNSFKWTRTGVTTLLAVSLLGLPAAATARERCDTQTRGSRQQAYYGVRDYGNSGYRAQRGDYRDYRSSSAYRNNSYRNRDYGYSSDPYYGDYRETRSPQKSAVIIGGGAAAGAAIGAMSGGAKGAAIGAAVGGVGGLIYDRATKNRGDRYGW